ncbi:MAG: hypothetical protein IJW82_05665 [Clostridia bacterium]|nr:hypothetical protein [Clostridia bacterium]
MEREYNRLEEYNIRTLRVMASQIGVKAPTRKSKEDLIQAIRDVLDNKIEPHFPKKPSIDALQNKIIELKTQMIEPIYNPENTKLMNTLYDTKEIKGQILYGYCRIMDSAYIDVTESTIIRTYHLSKELVLMHKLKQGDYVKFCYKYDELSKSNVVDTIFDSDVGLGKERQDFNEIKSILPTIKTNIKFNESDLYLGTRNIIKSENNRYQTIKEKIEVLGSEKVFNKKYILAINEAPEVVSLFKETYNVFPNTKYILDKIQELKLIVNNIKRNAEAGKNVLLVISNIQNLENFAAGSFYNQSIDEYQARRQAVSFIKELMNLGRNLENGGTVTVVAINDTDNETYRECDTKVLGI